MKIEAMNYMGTQQKQLISGDSNAVCTYCSGIVDTSSPLYKAAEARYRAGCILGGLTSGAMRTEAKLFVQWLLDTGCCHDKEEAMEILREESETHYNLYQGSFDGYESAVEKVCIDNPSEYRAFCLDRYQIDVASESVNVDDTTLYEYQKSFFSSRGYNAAVLKVYKDNKEEAFTYIKDRFPNQVSTREDITFEHMKSFFGSQGYNAAVQAAFDADQQGCLTYCIDKFPGEVESINDITFEHMKSYFASRGQNAAVLSVYEDNTEEAFIYIQDRFTDQVSTPEDVTFEHMSSYFGYYISRTTVEGILTNHDPHGILQYFEFTGNGIASLHTDYDVPQLRKLALMYKVELQVEVDAGVCDQITGSMPLTSFIKATERFIAKVDSLTDTDLPEGWTLPSALEYNKGDHDIRVENNINSQMCLVVTPNNDGVKAMTRHLTNLIIRAMEKFDRPVTIPREGMDDIRVEYPRFRASCKSRDSSENPKDEDDEPFEGQWFFSYSYLVLSKVLLQDPSDLSAKFYTCPKCSFQYNLMDTNELKGNKKDCTSKKKGGCQRKSNVNNLGNVNNYRRSGGL